MLQSIPSLSAMPRMPPRAWMQARIRDGVLVEIRPLGEQRATCTRANVWLGLDVSAPGSTYDRAVARCWRRWRRLGAWRQECIISAAVMKARAEGWLR